MLPLWGVVVGCGGVGCVCGVGMPLWLCLVGAAAGVSLFLVGRFAARIVACRAAVCLSAVSCSVACCWFVAVCVVCRLLWWCAIRECSRTTCDVVHVGLCGCAFDGNRDCRLLFTL